MQHRPSSTFPLVLLFIYMIEFLFLAIAPLDRTTWFVENITVLIIVSVIGILYARGIRFSNTAYGLMFVLIFLAYHRRTLYVRKSSV